MRILIVSHYFYPEEFRVNDIAFDFAKKGHEVTVLTGKPNYPQGKFFSGYGFFSKRKEEINGVNIIRIPLFPRLDGRGIFLALNYLSFLLFSFFAVYFRLKNEYDIVFSHLPSPLTSALPAVWIGKRFKIPVTLWVLDLWPESVQASSNIKNERFYRYIIKLVQYIYDNSVKILVSSHSFKKSIQKKYNLVDSKVDFFPNWAEDVFIKYESTHIPDLPEGFNILFAGNIGESQDFESIIEASRLTKDYPINWILVGDGRKLNWVKQKINKSMLSNVYAFGRYPLTTMPSFFNKADAMLVSLKDEPIFSLTIPAKIQAYMASKKIILGMLNGEGMKLINKSKVGFAVSAGDYRKLAENVINVFNLSESARSEIELNSKNYYIENFSKTTLFEKLENIFRNQINEKQPSNNRSKRICGSESAN